MKNLPILMNLMNFPFNLENLVKELEEDEQFLESLTTAEWIQMLLMRRRWKERDIAQAMKMPIEKVEKMKKSSVMPTIQNRTAFEQLLRRGRLGRA